MTQETYRFNVGSIECIVVTDAPERIRYYMDMYPQVDKDELRSAVQPYLKADDVLMGSFNCLVIKTGEQTLLLDTGLGGPKTEDSGRLLDNLQSVGITPDDIDTVILSHGHGDHVNGLVNDAGELVFSNANYVMWGQEWNYWTSEETLAKISEARAKTVHTKLLPIKDKVKLITSEDQEIAPGVCPMHTPGHSPGHMAVMIESDGERLLHIVDLSLVPFQPQHPEWVPTYDTLPEQAIETRRRIYEKAANEDLLVLAYHHPFPGLGYFRKQGDAYTWEAKED